MMYNNRRWPSIFELFILNRSKISHREFCTRSKCLPIVIFAYGSLGRNLLKQPNRLVSSAIVAQLCSIIAFGFQNTSLSCNRFGWNKTSKRDFQKSMCDIALVLYYLVIYFKQYILKYHRYHIYLINQHIISHSIRVFA